MAVEIAIFTAVIFGVVAGLLLENYRRKLEPDLAGAAPGKPGAPPPLRLTGPGRIVDSAADLRLVSDAGFASKPLLSGREADVLGYVEAVAAEAGQGWRVVPQVRLVDILASADAEANAVVGEHRIDMLIVSARHLPVAALDYQPLGQLKDDSALRDAIKREALRRADIPFLEIRTNEPLEGLKAQILRLAAAPVPVKAVRVRAPVKTVAAKAVTVKAAKPPAAKPAARAAAVKAAAPAAVVAEAVTLPKPAAKPKAPAKPAAKAAAKPAAKAASKPAAKPAAKTPAKTPAKPRARAAKPKAPPAEP